MSNKSAGSRPYDSGLVIQSRPEIDTNEFGLMEATFTFLTSISNWPASQPARATPCNEFDYGDTPTHTFLTGVSFMACQTARWKPAALSDTSRPGTLEVLCQGAIFNVDLGTFQRVSDVPVNSKGEGYDSPPHVNFTGGGQIIPASAVTRLEASTRQINNGGTGYVAGDVVTVSGGAFLAQAKLLVDVAGTGGSIKVADGGLTHFLDHGSYSVIPGLSAVALTGGTGSGATVDLTWRIDDVFMVDGGSYSDIPVASLSGGTPSTAGTLGTVVMGPGDGEDSQITTPFEPVSYTKETLQFTQYGTGAGTLSARVVATEDLGPVRYYTYGNGDILIESLSNIPLPIIDGVDCSVGDKILVQAETNSAYNGLYEVVLKGAYGTLPWRIKRVTEMDEADEISTQVFIQVSDGVSNHGTMWHCTTSSVTTLGTDPIAFAVVESAVATPVAQITIEYDAIDLHFEYMSKTRTEQARFIRAEYTRDEDGLIITDPTTGDRLDMPVYSAISQAYDDATGTFSPAVTTIDETEWRQLVKYVGASSRFDQTPAGAVWHVLETTSIRISPILPEAP